MKKLFFFKSSASSNGNNKPCPPPSTDKQIYWENPSEGGLGSQVSRENSFRSPKGLLSKSRKKVSDIQSTSESPSLRRSRSLSSAAFLGVDPGQIDYPLQMDPSRSPSSFTSSVHHQQFDHSFRWGFLYLAYCWYMNLMTESHSINLVKKFNVVCKNFVCTTPVSGC